MTTTRFIDAPMPPRIKGYPTSSTIIWNTSLVQSASGDEHANQNWKHPQIKIALPDAIRAAEDMEALKDHYYRTRGPFRTFPMRDPADFASVKLIVPPKAPPLSLTDVQIGVGDGLTKKFKLVKRYAEGTDEEYVRRIYLPKVDSALVGINGVAPGAVSGPNGGPYTFTVSRPGGIVEFDHAPHAGQVITAGYLFDTLVRYESDDSLSAAIKTYLAGGFGSFDVRSINPCGWES